MDSILLAIDGAPAALACDVDAIVLGSSPRVLHRRLVDGSMSLRLAAGAPVRVIVARPT